MSATVAGDIAQQPAILGDTQKRDPLKNVRKDIKKKKKVMGFKEWQKYTSEDEINEGEEK